MNQETETPTGFSKLGAETIEPILRRGVLVDAARQAKPSGQLGERYLITLEDIEIACAKEHVDIRSGDVAVVRTGYGALWNQKEKYLKGAGVSKEATLWFSERKVFAVGVDNLSWDVPGVRDPETGSTGFAHLELIVRNGIYIIENMFLDDLSHDGVYEFLFIGLPLKCKGFTGSPIRPIAIC